MVRVCVGDQPEVPDPPVRQAVHLPIVVECLEHVASICEEESGVELLSPELVRSRAGCYLALEGADAPNDATSRGGSACPELTINPARAPCVWHLATTDSHM